MDKDHEIGCVKSRWTTVWNNTKEHGMDSLAAVTAHTITEQEAAVAADVWRC